MQQEMELNLLDLESLFFGPGSGARKGFEQLAAASDGGPAAYELAADALSALTRSFDEPVLQFRNYVDDFLSYCGILEIACRIGYISRDDVDERYFSRYPINFDRVYFFGLLNKYYYTVLRRTLVIEFTERRAPAWTQEELFRPFQRFLGLELSVSGNRAIRAFMRLLDSVGVDEMRRVVGQSLRGPDEFFAILLKPVNELIGLDLALAGLHDLLDFCVKYDRLLRECEGIPEFRASIEAFYAPYFAGARHRCGEVLQAAVCQFLTWGPRSNDANVDQSLIVEGGANMLQILSNIIGATIEPPAAEAPMVRTA